MTRQGVVVEPYQRLKLEQVEQIHQASLDILTEPGILCYNRSAAEIFGDFGARCAGIACSNGHPSLIGASGDSFVSGKKFSHICIPISILLIVF